MNILEEIHGLHADQSQLLKACHSGRHLTHVRQFKHIRWLCNGGDAVQSVIDLNAPTTLLLPNHIAMLSGLFFVEHVKQILHLGMGGACIERFFVDRFPESSVTSVEISESIIAIAKQYFALPKAICVINDSAALFVKSTNESFDIMLCDIFDGESHPACISDPDFYRACVTRLSDDGAFVLNLYPGSQDDLVKTLYALRKHFPIVFLLEVENHGNVVVIALKQELANDLDITRKAASLSVELKIDISHLVPKLQRLPPAR